MGGATTGENCEIEPFPLQMNRYPIDLLQRFTAGNHRPTEFAASTEDAEEIELNLGLSLGGCFGVEPKEKRLVRSSSIAGLTTFVREDDAGTPPPVTSPAITRTCSLPAETEEERRKRKELQSLRRLEAKRKRSEKQRNFRAGKDRASMEGSCEEEKMVEDEGLTAMTSEVKVEDVTGFQGSPSSTPVKELQQQQYMVANGLSGSVAPPSPPGLPIWAAPARGASLPHGFDTETDGKGNVLAAGGGGAADLQGFPRPSSQGSVGSQGSGSSGISEQGKGPSSCTEVIQSLPDQSEQKPGIPTTETSCKVAVDIEMPKKTEVINNGVMEMGRNVMEEMPCVSTRGDGPNGKRIEGFLYRYRKGEEVRIVCVCHGSFLSPAEFVKHAGGGDVAHPLRHIVVNPSPSLL